MSHRAADPPSIAVSGLSKSFGTVRAVDDLSFTVEPGTITGFLGPNGAGKTTTLRMLLGLVSPDRGTATIGGRPYADIVNPIEKVGAVLEATSFHPGRTARNHLRIMCSAEGMPASRVDEVLGQVALTEAADRTVRGFSMGMRQRLGLAGALLGNPGVLILDEPANGLDPEGIHWLRGFLRHLADSGATVLVSSHVLSEIEQTVDSVVIVAGGRLVRQGSLETITSHAGEAVRVRAAETDMLEDAVRWAGAHCERVGPDALVVTGMASEQVGKLALDAGVALTELGTERSDLEQAFLDLTRAPEKEPQ